MNLRLVSMAAALVTATAIPAFAHDDRDKGKGNDEPLMVVDAKGKPVGKFGAGPDGVFVQFKTGGTTYAVDLMEAFPGNYSYSQADYAQLGYGGLSRVLYFFTNDCTGTAHMARTQSVGMKPTAVFKTGEGPAQRVYLFTFDGRNYNKGANFFSVWQGGVCQQTNGGGPGLALIGTGRVEITSMFKEPFRVE